MEYIAGLDVGTTKIGAIIGEVDDEGAVKIIGVAANPSEGLRRGVVVNLEKTVHSIAASLSEAEQMAGVRIPSVVAGVAGGHIRSINGRGVVAVSGPDNEITPDDVRRVIDAAQAVALPIDRELIHIIPQEFIVDDQRGIKDPVGLCGVRLEAEVHIVTGAITSAQNIHRCIEKAGYKVNDLVLEPLASSYAVVNDEEKELGVIVMDLGGGTTDMAIFFEGALRYTGVVTLGGRNVTNDIAYGLRTSLDEAERIKLRHGAALHSEGDKEEVVEVVSVAGSSERKVSKAVLIDIIAPRVEEILSLARQEIGKCDFSHLATAGMVVTGGGSLLNGVVEMAEGIFEMPVRRGMPAGFSGLIEEAKNPIHATGVGLVLYWSQQGVDQSVEFASGEYNLYRKIKERMRRWLGHHPLF